MYLHSEPYKDGSTLGIACFPTRVQSSGSTLLSISLMPDCTNFFPSPIMAPMALVDFSNKSGSSEHLDMELSKAGPMNSMRRHLEMYLQR